MRHQGQLNSNSLEGFFRYICPFRASNQNQHMKTRSGGGIKQFPFIPILIIYFFAGVMLTSCSAYKYNMLNTYLDSTNTVQLSQYPFSRSEMVLSPGEIVKVTFAGESEEVTNTFNKYGGAELTTKLEGTKASSISGQQIDKEGYIEFPLMGRIKAAGLTKSELQAYLQKAVEPYLKSPLVLVEIPSRGVTFLGEVKSSSTVSFPKERANLFEMLAEVGYATEYADMSRVKVYRENPDGSRELGTLNLNDTSFINSKYFYPLPNDVVYLPASTERSRRQVVQTIVPFTGLVIGIISLVVSFVR